MMVWRRSGPRLATPASTFVTGTVTYSSRDGHTGLVARYCYPTGGVDLPADTIMHGYGEASTAIASATMERRARYCGGACVIAIGMRGRDGATGSNTASGREIPDIIDGVEAVREELGAVVSSGRAFLSGYSGGGGNTLAVLAKCPDYFNFYVNHFGMVDYGATPGWHGTNNAVAVAAGLESHVGGTPSTVPAAYAARNHLEPALRNLQLAPPTVQLVLIHHASDNVVSVVSADNLRRRAVELGMGDRVPLTRSYSYTSDPHGYPETVPALATLEDTWWRDAHNAQPWCMPTVWSGPVAGFYISRNGTEVWLAASGTADPSTASANDHVATIAQNGNTFTVTPQTGAMSVRVRRGALVATNTNVTTTTTLVAA